LSVLQPSTVCFARRLSHEEIKAIVEDHERGLGISAIAAKHGIARSTVYRALERGRPSKASATKDVRIYCRLSVDDYTALKKLAVQRQETVSALSRRVLRRAAGFFDPDKDIVNSSLQLSNELKKIGTNLNQVVYQINKEALLQGRATPRNIHLETIRKMQRTIYSAVDNIDRFLVYSGRRRLTTVNDLLEKEID